MLEPEKQVEIKILIEQVTTRKLLKDNKIKVFFELELLKRASF